MNEHSGWNSKPTFVFAMIGATIGIGNIWRFSYVFYTNGGGSFFHSLHYCNSCNGNPIFDFREWIGIQIQGELFKAVA